MVIYKNRIIVPKKKCNDELGGREEMKNMKSMKKN